MKIAIVGTGSIGLSYLRAIASSQCCTISAICDVNEALAKQYGEQYGAPYFTDYQQIPESSDADAVVLNLPHWLHCEATEFFLDKGLHVLVEKPMANTPEECQRMIAAQKRSGKVLAVAHPQRFFQANRAVKQIVDSGELGELTSIIEFRTVDYFEPTRPKWFLNKKLSGGGIVMNYGAHALDKIMYITGSKPKSVVSSVGNRKTTHDIEGHAQFQVTLENGVTASVTFSGYHCCAYEDYFLFTNGALKVCGGTRLYKSIDREWVAQETPNVHNHLAWELMEFEKLIRGEPSEIPTAEFGANVIETIAQIYNG